MPLIAAEKLLYHRSKHKNIIFSVKFHCISSLTANLFFKSFLQFLSFFVLFLSNKNTSNCCLNQLSSYNAIFNLQNRSQQNSEFASPKDLNFIQDCQQLSQHLCMMRIASRGVFYCQHFKYSIEVVNDYSKTEEIIFVLNENK